MPCTWHLDREVSTKDNTYPRLEYVTSLVSTTTAKVTWPASEPAWQRLAMSCYICASSAHPHAPHCALRDPYTRVQPVIFHESSLPIAFPNSSVTCHPFPPIYRQISTLYSSIFPSDPHQFIPFDQPSRFFPSYAYVWNPVRNLKSGERWRRMASYAWQHPKSPILLNVWQTTT